MVAMTMVAAIDPMLEQLTALCAAVLDFYIFILAGVRMLRYDVIGGVYGAIEQGIAGLAFVHRLNSFPSSLLASILIHGFRDGKWSDK
jgi:hypothetical protein